MIFFQIKFSQKRKNKTNKRYWTFVISFIKINENLDIYCYYVLEEEFKEKEKGDKNWTVK